MFSKRFIKDFKKISKRFQKDFERYQKVFKQYLNSFQKVFKYFLSIFEMKICDFLAAHIQIFSVYSKTFNKTLFVQLAPILPKPECSLPSQTVVNQSKVSTSNRQPIASQNPVNS